MKKQIVAIGGADHPLFHLYILAQTNKKNPQIAFLGTGGCDNGSDIEHFYDSFERYPCTYSHLSLFSLNCENIREYILRQDAIYVGGGHTKNMLGIWKAWGLDRILLEAYNQGIVLGGMSAGSVCWFEQCITDSYGKGFKPMNCLGFLKGSNCPHYGGKLRRSTFHKNIDAEIISGGYAADDCVGLHFVDGELFRSISLDQSQFGYEVKKIDGKTMETKLDTIVLKTKANYKKYILDSKTFEG